MNGFFSRLSARQSGLLALCQLTKNCFSLTKPNTGQWWCNGVGQRKEGTRTYYISTDFRPVNTVVRTWHLLPSLDFTRALGDRLYCITFLQMKKLMLREVKQGSHSEWVGSRFLNPSLSNWSPNSVFSLCCFLKRSDTWWWGGKKATGKNKTKQKLIKRRFPVLKVNG